MCDSNDDWDQFTRALLDAGLWLPTGVSGVYGRSSVFESVLKGFESLITEEALRDGAEQVYFPPIMSRATITRTGYMQSFPELCGSIHSFTGSERDHVRLMESVDAHGDWGEHLSQTELTLVPAACYPLYPTLADTELQSARLFDLSSFVFRHEPSADPARMQIFRQKENVKIGEPADVEAWRAQWLDKGVALFEPLGLTVKLEVANDPFFGRGGKMLARNQTASNLKFEISTELFSNRPATAIASFNYHEAKFGEAFNIRLASGEPAHTACFGFGLERVTLALFKIHGLDTAAWPEAVRSRLGV